MFYHFHPSLALLVEMFVEMDIFSLGLYCACLNLAVNFDALFNWSKFGIKYKRQSPIHVHAFILFVLVTFSARKSIKLIRTCLSLLNRTEFLKLHYIYNLIDLFCLAHECLHWHIITMVNWTRIAEPNRICLL